MADYVGKGEYIKLQSFLQKYYGLTCNWKGKITHHRMAQFMELKGIMLTRGLCDKITKEQKLSGEYIYVMDHVGEIIPYKRPTISLNRLQASLITNNNEKKLEEIRLQYLNSQGLTYDEYGNVITIEEAKEMKRIEMERKEEEEMGKILDIEEKYYEKMSYTNRAHVKTKSDHRYRRAL